MVSIIVFHVLMVFLALGILIRVVPVQLVSDMVGYLHKTIGITTPSLGQARTIALIWIGSTVIIADGCLALLVFITAWTNAR